MGIGNKGSGRIRNRKFLSLFSRKTSTLLSCLCLLCSGQSLCPLSLSLFLCSVSFGLCKRSLSLSVLCSVSVLSLWTLSLSLLCVLFLFCLCEHSHCLYLLCSVFVRFLWANSGNNAKTGKVLGKALACQGSNYPPEWCATIYVYGGLGFSSPGLD